MKRFQRWFVTGLMFFSVLALTGMAARGAAKPKDPFDEPPPLNVGGDQDPLPSEDDAAVIAPPVNAPGGAKTPAKSATPAADKKPTKTASSSDPNSPDYSPDAGRTHAAGWEDAVASAEKDLTALKLAGGGKKDDLNDYFVLGTISIEDHKATVDYPVQQGLRKAAELIADFISGKPKGAVRQWRAVGRAKNEKAAAVLVKNARAQSIEGQLEAFKPSKPGKKSLDDFFVVGTGELMIATQNADIRFWVLGGTKATASFLLDFILGGSERTKRQWHVFFRAHTQDEADQYIAQLRNWYDTMETQRAQMAAIYNAKTTRRC